MYARTPKLTHSITHDHSPARPLSHTGTQITETTRGIRGRHESTERTGGQRRTQRAPLESPARLGQRELQVAYDSDNFGVGQAQFGGELLDVGDDDVPGLVVVQHVGQLGLQVLPGLLAGLQVGRTDGHGLNFGIQFRRERVREILRRSTYTEGVIGEVEYESE